MKEYWSKHKRELVLFMMYLVILPFFEILNRPIGQVHSLLLPIDSKIPFVIEFLPIYHSWFFGLFAYSIYLIQTDPLMSRVLSKTFFWGMIAAYITFIVYQSYIPRPVLTGDSFLEQLYRATLQVDGPYVGFPSCHVLTTWAMMLTMAKRNKRTLWIGLIWGTLVILSTVLVKQHVFMDIPGGMIYATVLFMIFYQREREKLDESIG